MQCHKAKNLVPDSGAKPTKVGKKCVELQRRLKLARVVYCSATGAALCLAFSNDTVFRCLLLPEIVYSVLQNQKYRVILCFSAFKLCFVLRVCNGLTVGHQRKCLTWHNCEGALWSTASSYLCTYSFLTTKERFDVLAVFEWQMPFPVHASVRGTSGRGAFQHRRW